MRAAASASRDPQWPQGDYASPPTFAATRSMASACLPLLAGLARELGVPRSGVAALLLAWRQPMAPGQLAAALGLTPSAMTTVVSDLVAARYATRAPDPDDGRRAVVAITEMAQDAVVATMRPLHAQLGEVDHRFGAARARMGRQFIGRAALALERGYALPTCGPAPPPGAGDTLLAVLRFAAVVAPMLAALAASLGIPRSEMDASLVIAERSSGPGDLALRLGITPSAGSQIAERLMARGLATKTTDPADGRRAVIAMSQAFLDTMAHRTLPFQDEVAAMDDALPAEQRDIGRAFMDSVTTAIRHIYG